MQEKHSKVNFRKLVHDLADMYQDSTFDVVLTEIVANALDAKATDISIDWDNAQGRLVVKDNGKGMNSSEFEQYHDFATELKTRGSGIGFAGVGAKISFKIADRVITTTRCNGVVNSSDWYWDNDGSLCWKSIKQNGMDGDGTCVEIHFNADDVPPSVTGDYLINVLKHHYLPLFITEFLRSYAKMKRYSAQLRFRVNGELLHQTDLPATAKLIRHENFVAKVRGNPVGGGMIGISEQDNPIGGHSYGILLSTHGKVIKPELFGLSTGMIGARLCGVVEIPDLIDYLTTNKSDLKGGLGRSQKLNEILDSVREVMQRFLAKHGVAVEKPRQNQMSAKLERELTKMVNKLPELQDFDGLLQKSRTLRSRDDNEKSQYDTGDDESTKRVNNDRSHQSNKNKKTKPKRRRSRRKQGPRVAFEDHPDRQETAWISSNTIIINSGHAAYRNQITQDQARLTYCMFAIGIALDKADFIESSDSISYVDKFVATWGES